MRFDRRKDIHPKYLLLTFTIIGIVLIVLSYAAAPKVAGIRRFTSKLITPIQKGINEIGLWTDSKMKNLNEIKTLTDENEALQAELASCKQEITNYQNKMLELQELRDLYDLDESYPDYEMTAAHVFAKDSTSWFSTFYIDKGTKQELLRVLMSCVAMASQASSRNALMITPKYVQSSMTIPISVRRSCLQMHSVLSREI